MISSSPPLSSGFLFFFLNFFGFAFLLVAVFLEGPAEVEATGSAGAGIGSSLASRSAPGDVGLAVELDGRACEMVPFVSTAPSSFVRLLGGLGLLDGAILVVNFCTGNAGQRSLRVALKVTLAIIQYGLLSTEAQYVVEMEVRWMRKCSNIFDHALVLLFSDSYVRQLIA